MSDKKLKITMGFKNLNSSVVVPDNDSNRGQIQQIKHMVKVEEVEA